MLAVVSVAELLGMSLWFATAAVLPDMARQAAIGETRQALLSSSVHSHEERNMRVPLYQEQRNEATLELIRATLDEATFAGGWERGKHLTLDEAVALALGESIDEGDEPVAGA